MSEIISRERIRERARKAFQAGQSRDSHNMNWHSDARTTWLIEFDHLAAMAAADKSHQERAA